MKMKIRPILILILFLLIIICKETLPNERKFSYVYQSDVLGKGSREIEITSTTRLGKDFGYYGEFDNRIEFEVGLSKKLQSAFYINFSQITTDNGTGTNQTNFHFDGISSEWKLQITNPYKDALGFALYTELGLNTDEAELETKLIFDKKIKKTSLALNLTYEPEWYLSPGKAEVENNIVGSFGLSYAFTPNISAGFEIVNHNIFTKDKGWENSALFAGPNISFSQPNWWVTFTVLPQLLALKGKTPGRNLNYNDYTAFESRLIFSFHI